MSRIHSSAVVHSAAELDSSVEIGPFCVLGEHVRIGAGTKLRSHVVVEGRTTLGQHNTLFPFSSLGHQPQDLKYEGEPSELIIGNHNTIRENVTMNPGTKGGGMVTRIGSHNLIMAYAHVAHDCIVGDHNVLANCATLAGHVEIKDGTIIGGLAGVHQFVTIGSYAMLGGACAVNKDVPPFCMCTGGYRAALSGLNLVALRRKGTDKDAISALKKIYAALFQSTEPMQLRLEKAEGLAADFSETQMLIDFVRQSKRGVCFHLEEEL